MARQPTQRTRRADQVGHPARSTAAPGAGTPNRRFLHTNCALLRQGRRQAAATRPSRAQKPSPLIGPRVNFPRPRSGLFPDRSRPGRCRVIGAFRASVRRSSTENPEPRGQSYSRAPIFQQVPQQFLFVLRPMPSRSSPASHLSRRVVLYVLVSSCMLTGTIHCTAALLLTWPRAVSCEWTALLYSGAGCTATKLHYYTVLLHAAYITSTHARTACALPARTRLTLFRSSSPGHTHCRGT